MSIWARLPTRWPTVVERSRRSHHLTTARFGVQRLGPEGAGLDQPLGPIQP